MSMRTLTQKNDVMMALLAWGSVAVLGFSCQGSVCGTGTELRDGICLPVGTPQEIACGLGTVEHNGECVLEGALANICTPICAATGLECGPDGCGGECGTCGADKPYCNDGICGGECVSDCSNRECGDDGCFRLCGLCIGATTCSEARRCVPNAWTCDPLFFADGVACDCGCGAPDRDCDDAALPLKGCTGVGATCVAGACVGGGWTCAAEAFGDGVTCDCNCGAPDPDCALPNAPVMGCTASSACNPDGTCCVRDCVGKTCGSDGCGRECGTCSEPTAFCNNGVCEADCQPRCAGKVCGSDGCGGQCGDCAASERCTPQGTCEPTPAGLSCSGHCGEALSSTLACSCEPSCLATKICCDDAELFCGCFPKCAARECGSDGCGGSCGTCPQSERCSNGFCVVDLCQPDPCTGHGTCNLADGACTCAEAFQGVSCDQCSPGFVGYPNCRPSACELLTCNLNGECNPQDGTCTCSPGFTGARCDACVTGHGTYPECTP